MTPPTHPEVAGRVPRSPVRTGDLGTALSNRQDIAASRARIAANGGQGLGERAAELEETLATAERERARIEARLDALRLLRETIGQGFWSTLGNYLGLPAGNVPARLGEFAEGPKPIGVQILGRRWREDLVVDAMIAIEDRLGTLSRQLWARMG